MSVSLRAAPPQSPRSEAISDLGFRLFRAMFARFANGLVNREPVSPRPTVVLAGLVVLVVILLRNRCERVSDPRSVRADHVGVHPQRDRRIRVAQPLGHDMDRDAGRREHRGVHMPQVVPQVAEVLAGRFDGSSGSGSLYARMIFSMSWVTVSG